MKYMIEKTHHLNKLSRITQNDFEVQWTFKFKFAIQPTSYRWDVQSQT